MRPMHFISACLLWSLVCMLPPAAFGQFISERPDFAGIWVNNGGVNRDLSPYSSFTAGEAGRLQWSKMEPIRNQTDFSDLDAALTRAVTNNKYYYFVLWTGQNSPSWIYDFGVPLVTTDTTVAGNTHPYYLDSGYKTYVTSFFVKLANHLKTLSPAMRSRLAFIQPGFGSTGDQQLYKGNPLDPQYAISSSQFLDFMQFMTRAWHDAFNANPETRSIRFLWNLTDYDGTNPADLRNLSEQVLGEKLYCEWMYNNYNCQLQKQQYTPAIGYMVNNEKTQDEDQRPAFFGYSTPLRWNGNPEYIRGEHQEDFFAETTMALASGAWHHYWTAVSSVDRGLDGWETAWAYISTNKYNKAFEFSSRYSFQKEAEKATDAFIALRDVLDYSDSSRFPLTAEFGGGTLSRGNTARIDAILAKHAAYGARNDDTAAVVSQSSAGYLTASNGLNDCVWNVLRENYSRHITQYDPNGTSVGLWRVGSTNDPYGRFARRFDNASGKNAMHFKFADAFVADPPAQVTFKVIYYDIVPNSTWALQYKDAAGIMTSVSPSVPNTGDGTWKNFSVTVNNPGRYQNGANTVDFALLNTDGLDDTFHVVEVHRAARSVPTPPALAYSLNPATYFKGTPITVNTATSNGGTVLSYAVSPALPAGLSLNTTTGVISGTPTVVIPMATYTVTATKDTGPATVALDIRVKDVPPTALAYSSNPVTYNVGAAIANNSPTSSGGPVVSYAVKAALPSGLTLNPSTGVISGTPTAASVRTSYTVIATNTGGSSTASLTITVNAAAATSAPTALTYSSNPAIYSLGTAITDNTPASSGGAVASYTVSPALPAGLLLDLATGVISGTPTETAGTASYTVTATNNIGSTTASVSITVNDIAPSALAYSSNPATYNKGTAIPNNTPASSGGAIVSYAVSPTLPAGLALNTSTGVISGTPTVVVAQSNYTVTATNAGGSTTTTLTITVNNAAGTSNATYTNSSSITINDNAAASPYPSTITVPTTSGTIANVTVQLNGFNHTYPSDVAMLLVGPAGQKFLLIYHKGGGADAVNANLSFADSASATLPRPIVTGTYKPPTYSAGNYNFPTPAPANPYSSGALSVFNETNPTGVWSLYVRDDSASDSGTLSGGWSLSITVTLPAVSPPASLTYSSNPATYNKGVAIPNNTPSSSGGAVASYAVSPALPAGLTLDTTTGFISGTPTAVAPTATYTITATNSSGSTTATVSIGVIDGVTTLTTSGTWTCPSGVTSIQVECWGGGGAGGLATRNGQTTNTACGGGGAGGAYAKLNSYPVTPGVVYFVNVGAGGVSASTDTTQVPGGDSWFNSVNSPSATIIAKGGAGGETVLLQSAANRFGAGGTGTASGSVGDVVNAGGSGVTTTAVGYGGGGGGSGGSGNTSGGNPGITPATNLGVGAAAVSSGIGGNGGNGGISGSGSGLSPTASPGGGGGGARSGSGSTFSGGTGAAGQVVLTVTSFSPPGAPTSVSATAGNAQATVSFTAPTSNGSAPITGYTVTSIPAGGTDINAGTTALSHTITDLTNGTAYTFTVTATNSVGTGAASSASLPVTPATVSTVTTPTSASIIGTSATLGGNVINDGGATVTERGVVFAPSTTNANPQIGGTGVTTLPGTGTTGVFTVSASSLTPGTSYTFAAYATNSQGTSYTTTASITTLSNDATLSALALSAGGLSPAFANGTITYTASVSNTTTSTTLTPTVTQANATVTVNGATVISGSASDSIALSPGSNTIATVVTAQDGLTTQTYTITVNVNVAAPSGLTYTSNPATYATGTVIANNTPTSSGGAVDSYSVSPALPAGLTLDITTGVISGTPMAVTDTAGYTVTAINTGGFTTAALNIAVVEPYTAWSTQYNLLQGQEGDDDGDGNSNYFEFVAGLDPTNTGSVFRTTTKPVPGQANQMTIVFSPIVSGRTYAVKSSGSLEPATWIPLSGATSSDDGNERTVIDTAATEERKFYVVEISIP